MKLSELKVGMRVRRDDEWPEYEVVKIESGWVCVLWFRADGTADCCINRNFDGWIEIKPKQKPSERIREIMLMKSYGLDASFPTEAQARCTAIAEYLDEQAESSK